MIPPTSSSVPLGDDEMEPRLRKALAGTLYDNYSVVSVQAMVWRCDTCGEHVPSPAEHEKRHDLWSQHD